MLVDLYNYSQGIQQFSSYPILLYCCPVEPELTLAQKTLIYLFEKILPIQPRYVPPYLDALATYVLANRMG